jgi:hypothetical protein
VVSARTDPDSAAPAEARSGSEFFYREFAPSREDAPMQNTPGERPPI